MPGVNVFVAAGTVLGAGVGAAAGMTLSSMQRRRRQKLAELPDAQPSAEPDAQPSAEPDAQPSAEPNAQPSAEPDTQPSSGGAGKPSDASISPPATAPPPEPTVATPKKSKHTVFDSGTYYLTPNSEFFTPLSRFYNLMQFQEEREAFKNVIVAIDGILGMEILLNARAPVTAAQIPGVAQRARNQAKQALQAIIDFSHEQRPSETKRGSMKELGNSLLTVIDEIIADMHKTIAAAPITDAR